MRGTHRLHFGESNVHVIADAGMRQYVEVLAGGMSVPANAMVVAAAAVERVQRRAEEDGSRLTTVMARAGGTMAAEARASKAAVVVTAHGDAEPAARTA